MRVAYDPQVFLRQRSGGISRLFTDLIGSLDADPSIDVETILPFSFVNNAHAAAQLDTHNLKMSPPWIPRAILYSWWMARGLPRDSSVDIIHHTYYASRFLSPAGTARRACTVYDMIPELTTGTPAFTGSHLAKIEYVRQSDLVICISESTRNDLLDHVGSVSGLVTVVPCAVGPGFRPGLSPVEGLPESYLMYVGGRKGYKDFSILPEAVAELASRGLVVDVVVVGAAFTAGERDLLKRLRVQDRFHRVSLDDEDLRRAYSNCVAVVQTSRYEGFGMTPLEGMASGVPVVVADASAMPEVGGDVARYFAPGEAESLAEQLSVLLTDRDLRSRLGDQGLVRATHFTVEKLARRTAEAYRQVLD